MFKGRLQSPSDDLHTSSGAGQLITTLSRGFDESPYLKLLIGYYHEKEQYLYLLVKSPLNAPPHLLVMLRGHATLTNFQSSSYGQDAIIKFRQEYSFWRRPVSGCW